MQFEIKHRLTGDVQFTAELSANHEHKQRSVQLGAAVRMALQAGAVLRGADLQGADLRGADLQGADLQGADLRGADLRDADLRDANLLYADLRCADLWHADLWGADLRDANLWGADLRHADLRHADLRYADLRYADLRGADLRIYHGIYTVIVTPSHVQIGCERRTPEDWLGLTDDDAELIDGERAVAALRQDGAVIKAMIEQMRPDLAQQPADRPKCTHTRLTTDRCPVCGPLDSDNRPITDGDTAAPDPAAELRHRRYDNQPAQGERQAVYLIRTDKGLWRPNARGYTNNPAEAGRYTHEEAKRHTRGLGPEKQAWIIHEDDLTPADKPKCCRATEAHTLERAAQDCEERARERDEAQSEHANHTFEWVVHGRMAAAHRQDAVCLRDEAHRIRNLRDGSDT